MSTIKLTSEHEHSWQLVVHIDACHYFQSSYSCECGATRYMWEERKMREKGGYGPVWALEDCERCQALLTGARRKRRSDKVFPAP